MATKKAVKAATPQPATKAAQPASSAAPAKVQTPPNTTPDSAEPAYIPPNLDVRLAAAEREYTYHVRMVGQLGDLLRDLRAELAAERS